MTNIPERIRKQESAIPVLEWWPWEACKRSRVSPSHHQGWSGAQHQTNLYCKQEEADTHMILYLKLHIRDTPRCTFCWHRCCSLGYFHFFSQLHLSKLWVGFGSGRTFREIPIHDIVQELGPQQCHSLLFFTHLQGVIMTSDMKGIGKKTAWNIWRAFPHFIATFTATTNYPDHLLNVLDIWAWKWPCKSKGTTEMDFSNPQIHILMYYTWLWAEKYYLFQLHNFNGGNFEFKQHFTLKMTL